MNAKNFKRNTKFQIVNFLAGSCHTPDGMYSLLCEQRHEREEAIKAYHVAEMRLKAREIRAKRKLWNLDAAVRWDALADLQEIKDTRDVSKLCFDAAEDELKFFNELIEQVQPHRLHKGLPDAEAHEAAQCEEWGKELIHRAKVAYAATGFIPADTLGTLLMHPDWNNGISQALIGLFPHDFQKDVALPLPTTTTPKLLLIPGSK